MAVLPFPNPPTFNLLCSFTFAPMTMVYRYPLSLLFALFTATSFSQPGNVIGIAAVTLKMQNGKFTAILTDFTTVSNTANRLSTAHVEASGYMPCYVLGKGNHILDTLRIPDPFHLRLEYPADGQTIGSVETSLTERNILVRFSHTPDVRALQFALQDPQRGQLKAKVKIKD